MILWNIVPMIQDATYTKHVYQHSKHYVGVGSLANIENAAFY